MKMSKITTAIFGLAVAAGISSSTVFAMSVSDAIAKAEELKDKVQGYAEYMGDKDYDKIPDGNVRSAVKHFCKEGCNRVTCKKSEVKAGCKIVCPHGDVKHCLSA